MSQHHVAEKTTCCCPREPGVYAAIANCPAATARASRLRAEAISGESVGNGRAGNGSTSTGMVAGLAWLRNHKLELAEDPVDLREIGTGRVHVLQEASSQLYRQYLAWVAEDSGIPALIQVAKVLRTEHGDATVAYHTIKAEGVTVPAFVTFTRWDRTGHRSRELGDGAPLGSATPT